MILRLSLCGLLAVTALPLHATEPLTMSVSPTMAMAPTNVRIRLRIEPDSRNRALQLVVDSGGFYRSSLLALDGERAPMTVVVEYRSVPGGNYVISGTLSDDAGHVRAVANREIVVISSRVD